MNETMAYSLNIYLVPLTGTFPINTFNGTPSSGGKLVFSNIGYFRIYQYILETNVKGSVQQLKLGLNLVVQQDNDPKHTSKLTPEWIKKKPSAEVISQASTPM